MSTYLEIKDKQCKLFKDTNLCINNTFIDFNSIHIRSKIYNLRKIRSNNDIDLIDYNDINFESSEWDNNKLESEWDNNKLESERNNNDVNNEINDKCFRNKNKREYTSECDSESMYESDSEYINECASGYISECASGYISECASGYISECASVLECSKDIKTELEQLIKTIVNKSSLDKKKEKRKINKEKKRKKDKEIKENIVFLNDRELMNNIMLDVDRDIIVKGVYNQVEIYINEFKDYNTNIINSLYKDTRKISRMLSCMNKYVDNTTEIYLANIRQKLYLDIITDLDKLKVLRKIKVLVDDILILKFNNTERKITTIFSSYIIVNNNI